MRCRRPPHGACCLGCFQRHCDGESCGGLFPEDRGPARPQATAGLYWQTPQPTDREILRHVTRAELAELNIMALRALIPAGLWHRVRPMRRNIRQRLRMHAANPSAFRTCRPAP